MTGFRRRAIAIASMSLICGVIMTVFMAWVPVVADSELFPQSQSMHQRHATLLAHPVDRSPPPTWLGNATSSGNCSWQSTAGVVASPVGTRQFIVQYCNGGDRLIFHHRMGWPVAAMESGGKHRYTHCWHAYAIPIEDERALPLKPRPLGFLLCTLTWGGFAAAAILSPELIMFGVRTRRLRHGKCPKCTYDLTNNQSGVCPECGHETPSTG